MPKKTLKKAKKNIKKIIENEHDDKVLFAFLATFLSIIGFVIALIARRDDKYVMYYAKLSLIIFLIGVVGAVISGIFWIIPVVGQIINLAVGIIFIVLWILSWIYALTGEEKDLPIVSDWARKLNI